MRRLLGFLQPHKKLVIWLVIANIFLSAMLTVAPLVTKAIVDQVIGQKQFNLLLPFLGLLMGVAIARATATFFYSYGQNLLGQYVMTDVRYALYRKLLALQFSFYDQNQTGRLMSRVSSDVESTRLFLSQVLVESVNHLTTIVLSMIVLLGQDWRLAALIVLPLIGSGVGLFLTHRHLREPWAKQHDRFAKLSAVLQDCLSGIKVVKAFAQEAQEQHKFVDAAQAVRHGNQGIQDAWNIRWSVIGSIGRFMQLLLIAVGGYLVMNGGMTLGTLVAAISLSMLLLGAVNALGTQLNSFSQTATASVRIFELLDEPITIKSPQVQERSYAVETRDRASLLGEVEFRDVSFGYPRTNDKSLKHINLRVPAGTSLAIVGSTGAGKTTLINLMGRFYEANSGHVLVDGKDVRDYPLDELRHQIGYVAQDSLLFSASIAENIAFGRPDATQDEIEQAAKLAQAHDFINKLPEGYKTKIGERGIGLSGGQRQRVAIARAFLLNPRILILDDSMSAVDAHTEKLLQAAVREVMRGRTSIVIAHRMSTVEHADRIIVLRDGAVAEEGTHDQLLHANGYYKHVLDLQRMSGEQSLEDVLSRVPNAYARPGFEASAG
jgi:ATP-binding cassette, subfamily B, multidrug efflux pump